MGCSSSTASSTNIDYVCFEEETAEGEKIECLLIRFPDMSPKAINKVVISVGQKYQDMKIYCETNSTMKKRILVTLKERKYSPCVNNILDVKIKKRYCDWTLYDFVDVDVKLAPSKIGQKIEAKTYFLKKQ